MENPITPNQNPTRVTFDDVYYVEIEHQRNTPNFFKCVHCQSDMYGGIILFKYQGTAGQIHTVKPSPNFTYLFEIKCRKCKVLYRVGFKGLVL